MAFLFAKKYQVHYYESIANKKGIPMKKRNKILSLILSLVLLLGMTGCLPAQQGSSPSISQQNQLSEEGNYTSKEDVALYLHTYEKLPQNYITKSEAQKLGWKQKGTLDEVAPGKSIGGDKFGNFEGKLPKKNGRIYRECDIDYQKGNRNAKRIIYSNDGQIYYTEDHYKTFEELYGEKK